MKFIMVKVTFIISFLLTTLYSQGLDDSFNISASGIMVQKLRISLIAENISREVAEAPTLYA